MRRQKKFCSLLTDAHRRNAAKGVNRLTAHFLESASTLLTERYRCTKACRGLSSPPRLCRPGTLIDSSPKLTLVILALLT
jgi:hypothetical protein